MAITEIQRAKLGPEWKPFPPNLHIDLLHRAYFSHGGSVNFEDLEKIGRQIAGYGFSANETKKGRLVFTIMGVGSVAFDFPPFAAGNGGNFTEGTTEVHTRGQIPQHTVVALAILLKDGMNGRYIQPTQVVVPVPRAEKFLELD